MFTEKILALVETSWKVASKHLKCVPLSADPPTTTPAPPTTQTAEETRAAVTSILRDVFKVGMDAGDQAAIDAAKAKIIENVLLTYDVRLANESNPGQSSDGMNKL